MKQNKGFAVIVSVLVFFALLILSGIVIFNYKKDISSTSTSDDSSQVMYQKSGNAAEVEGIEDLERVSGGNSFLEIENDIDSTVILEEDFSDL